MNLMLRISSKTGGNLARRRDGGEPRLAVRTLVLVPHTSKKIIHPNASSLGIVD